MSRPVDLAAVADAIRQAWTSGRCCPLIGRGARARVLRAARLVEVGMLTPDAAARVAAEAREIAMAFAPLPEPPL